jgi:hypothetical protein
VASKASQDDKERRGRLLNFWRSARRENRRWWGSLADPPKRRRSASLIAVVVFFAFGALAGAALWFGWIALPGR